MDLKIGQPIRPSLPMHRPKRKRARWPRVIAVIAILGMIGYWGWSSGPEEASETKPGARALEAAPGAGVTDESPAKVAMQEGSKTVAEGESKPVHTASAPPAPAPVIQDYDSAAVSPLPLLPQQGPAGVDVPAGLPNVVVGRIESSLYGSFAKHFDRDDKKQRLTAEQLAAHFKRLFFFDVNFKRDLRPGDRYAFVWEYSDESTDGIRILAAQFKSSLHNRLFTAFYFKDPKDDFARHYGEDGASTQLQLNNPPLKSFEQVTSLLNDRRPRHSGIDFKAPVGTPIYLPWDADVLVASSRASRRNGRWVKVRYRKNGLEGLFLHMDSVDAGVQPGKHLRAGTPLGTLGNTGRSYAPHLHYQLQKSKGRILNPYDIHGSRRFHVSASGKAAFEREVGRYKALMPRFTLEPPPESSAARR